MLLNKYAESLPILDLLSAARSMTTNRTAVPFLGFTFQPQVERVATNVEQPTHLDLPFSTFDCCNCGSSVSHHCKGQALKVPVKFTSQLSVLIDIRKAILAIPKLIALILNDIPKAFNLGENGVHRSEVPIIPRVVLNR